MRHALWAFAILAFAAPNAAARTTPNPAGRTAHLPADARALLSGEALRGSALRAEAVSSAAAICLGPPVNVPLPVGAVQIDSTYYDLQDFGSLGTRIVAAPDGRIHLIYNKDFCEIDPGGCPPNPNDPRGFPHSTGYAYRSAGGVWNRLGRVQDPTIHCSVCVPQPFGAFGTVAVTPDGRAAIAQHKEEDGCDLRGDTYLEDAAGGSTFTAYLSPITDPSYLFPQVVALANGSYVMCGEIPRGGSYDETDSIHVTRLAAAGTHFTCPVGWQFGAWTQIAPTSIYRDGRGAFPCLAASSNGRVGIAVTDFGGNVFLIESSDGTFSPASRTIRNLTNYSDAAIVKPDSTSTEWRPYIHCHLAYNDTTPHVVWSELQARKSGSTIFYTDWHSRIRHWSSTSVLSTVKQVQAGEADSYDNIDLGLHGPLSGFNTISVDWPQVGFSRDGNETYVAWLRFVDGEVDTCAIPADLVGIATATGFGDIALSMRGSGDPWSAPQNLTSTPNTDERFFSLAAGNDGGKAHIVFQASATNQAGCALIGDRGGAPGNLIRRIAYLERPISGTLVDVGDATATALLALHTFPNPALDRVRFALGGSAASGRTVEVYAVNGRLIAKLAIPGGGSALWNGRDRLGNVAPSGLYLARVSGSNDVTPVKFMLLH